MKNTVVGREIRVGVLGVGRGKSLVKSASMNGLKLVAICDNFKARLDQVCNEIGVAGYTDFDEFIKQDFDAVIIASCFHQHAPFAKKALLAGKHVLSETSTSATLREGVELYKLAEESGLCYMLAENYCYTRFVQEMKRLYEADEIGAAMYGEAEYNHPMSLPDIFHYCPGGVKHWRSQLPGCYYITHALAPMMYIMNAVPVEVSSVLLPKKESSGKEGYVALVRMDNGAVVRIFAGTAGHSCAYELHGQKGAMESVHGHGYFGPETIRVWHEPWEMEEGQCEDKTYLPNWPSDAEKASKCGHGGGDFFVEKAWAHAIRTGEQPFMDAYHGIMCSNVGIMAWKSAHNNGVFMKVPDLKNEADCAEMLEDNWTPFEGVENSRLYPEEMRWQRVITPDQYDLAREKWKELGYTDAEVDEMLKA
ncbi:MAG: Gfo/Idh/MocA family oxidoreductase [Clostridia bacterium]|nr:Gfo/Idh/MocA family oxidoreductase [Clostridia bacterium]